MHPGQIYNIIISLFSLLSPNVRCYCSRTSQQHTSRNTEIMHSHDFPPHISFFILSANDPVCLCSSSASPEKQRHCTRTCVTSDGCSNTIDLNFSIKFRKSFLHKPRHFFCIFQACRLGNIAFSGIIKPILRILLHLIHNCADYLFLCADLKSWDQFSLIVHIQKRTDIQHSSKKSTCFGNTTSSDIESKICGKEPML